MIFKYIVLKFLGAKDASEKKIAQYVMLQCGIYAQMMELARREKWSLTIAYTLDSNNILTYIYTQRFKIVSTEEGKK